MSTKPTEYPLWATGSGAQIVEPTDAKKALGWLPGERPPAQWENWKSKNVSDWIQYLDGHTEGWVNVKDHGAVGDGVADDTQAIRDALAEAGRPQISSWDFGQGLGGVVFFPRGIYRVTDTISWDTDNTHLVGEEKHAASIYLDLGNPNKDGIVVGVGVNNARRSGIHRLSIFTPGTGSCRDGVVFNSTTWWKMSDVDITRVGRYGLHVNGTYDGVAVNVRCGYNGDSGLLIEKDSGGTATTVLDFYAYYALNNARCGAIVRSGHTLNFYSFRSEYNGADVPGADPDQCNGLRLDGGTTEGDGAEVVLYGGYFESNLGHDILAGTGSVGGGIHHISAYGVRATPIGAAPKAANYGFYRGLDKSQGSFDNCFLSSFYVGGPYTTYRWEDNAVLFVHGASLSEFGVNQQPKYYVGGVQQPTDQGVGIIETRDPNGELAIRGRHAVYVGGPGGFPAIRLERGSAFVPGFTYSPGDLVVNSDPSLGAARAPMAFRNIGAGAPGNMETLFAGSLPLEGMVLVAIASGSNAVDASWRVFGLGTTGNPVFTVGLFNTGGYNGSLAGRIFTVRVDNRSPGALTGMSWDSVYKFANNTAPAAPAVSRSLYVTFVTDGAGAAYELNRAVDVPWA